ncbi:CsbD family protein [Desulfonatronum parangueonense]
MNWDKVKGNWSQAKGTIKSKWGKLTDDELTQIDGEREKFIGKIQEKYGIARDEAEKQVDDWTKNY